jgi:hypothetical protein
LESIYAKLGYKLRKSVQESKEELPRIGFNKSKLVNPTINYLLDSLTPFKLTESTQGGYVCNCYSDHDVLSVETILNLLGIDL